MMSAEVKGITSRCSIEVAREPLRHIGDALEYGVALRAPPQVPPQNLHLARLNPAHPGDDPEQGRFAHAVGPDQPAHATRWQGQLHPVEGVLTAVGVAEPP
jgi:hypothetical protein